MVTDPVTANTNQLALQAQSGSSEAFASLVEQWQHRLLNFLCHMGVQLHDAEDLTQETFLRAYRHLDRYNPQFSFSSWIFTIAKRLALNHFRDTRETCDLKAVEQIDAQHPGIHLEHKEAAISIWDFAKSLPADQYEALWLRYGEDFSINEVARVMKTNSIRVRVLLHRGRQRLGEILSRRNQALSIQWSLQKST